MLDDSLEFKIVDVVCISYKSNQKWVTELIGSDFRVLANDYATSMEIFEDSLFNYLTHDDIKYLFEDVSQTIIKRQQDIISSFNNITILSVAKINAGLTTIVIQNKLLEN